MILTGKEIGESWLLNLLIGLSMTTMDWSCNSGWRAWTAKLHHALERKSIVSGHASEGEGLEFKSMQLGLDLGGNKG